MSSTVRIVAYRDFCDFPRAFIVNISKDGLLLFDCRFDELLDDYSSSYRIFVLRGPIERLPKDWHRIDVHPDLAIDEITTSELRFDISRRQEVTIPNADVLFAKAEMILAAQPDKPGIEGRW